MCSVHNDTQAVLLPPLLLFCYKTNVVLGREQACL